MEVVDLGTYSAESVDYPEYGIKCAEAVAKGEAEKGIVVCGTGIGISIAANKVKGIRCALCTSVEMAKLSREHNNANMLALGGRTTKPEDALMMVDTWIKTEFLGDRHARRVAMLDEYGCDE
jgi:ribose 5-phosphate isomerase B